MVDELLDETLTEDPTPVDPPAPEPAPTPPYDSILVSIRKKIGGYVEDDSFDEDLITNINTSLSILTQLGVGPEDGFFITGENETWTELLGPHAKPAKLHMVKDFVFLQTKMIFDPPQVGGVLNAYQAQLDMLTWRLNVAVDPGD